MLENILEITNQISNKQELINLKNKLISNDTNIEEFLKSYINQYNYSDEYETKTYSINLGYNKSLNDFKKDINRLKPYSKPKNYRENIVKANAPWKNIYEIAFGSADTSIKVKTDNQEINKQIKIKEVN